MSGDLEKKKIGEEFRRCVNMPTNVLEQWLECDDSRSVGWTHEGDSESVGHQSGRRIVELLRKRPADYSDDDYAHMRKVIGYIHRHSAQRPAGDVGHSRWRFSLMNWGHDPLRA